MPAPIKYRGYNIRESSTVFVAYTFAHDDYDGAPDGREFLGVTPRAATAG